ncbi:MAG: GTP-binding protein [Candidatus Heimdallarchaeota archaeon]|nr:GTP-binding protein [Candidatus Heimdallarchaeota archaeon]
MEEKKSSDYLWKIVLCGTSFVGKTTIRKRAMGEHFAEEYISTVGADFSSYKLRLGDLTIGFQVWDLAGQDKYKYIRSSFYGGATGCFLVFDVTNPKSLKDLSSWVDEAIRYSNGTIEIFVICANKIDLKGYREITRDMGEKYASAIRESSGLQCEYIETSALTGENIDVAFDQMAKCLLEREGISPIQPIEEIIETAEESPVHVSESPVDVSEPLPTESTIEPTTTKVIDTIPSTSKSILIEEDSGEATEKLIAEVMAVLDETDEIIIGREKTADGERAITVTKDEITEQAVEDEQEPKISNELERVLGQINIKLDSLTDRLKGLEEEISQVKPEELLAESEEEIVDISDMRDELDIITQETFTTETLVTEEEPFTEIIEEVIFEPEEEEEPELPEPMLPLMDEFEKDKLDEDQKVLESLVETIPLHPKPIQAQEIEEDIEEEDEEEIEELEEEISEPNPKEKDTQIRYLADIPDNELVEIPDEEPLLSIDDEGVIEEVEDEISSDDSVIGTELSSAMISELKDMSEDEEEQVEATLTQPVQVERIEKKNHCPICGEDTKYIRQYNKYYCVKCGRYLI